MRKKILLIVVISAVFVTAFTLLYRQFGSKTVAMERKVDTVDTVITQSIKLNEIAEFSKNNPGEHVFFLRDGKKDSDYVIDSLLTPLAKEQLDRPTPNIVSVDLSDAKDLTVTRLKNMFGVETYPAFVYASYDANKNILNVTSSIISDSKKPMTIEQLRAWFFNNDLWSGPYNQ